LNNGSKVSTGQRASVFDKLPTLQACKSKRLRVNTVEPLYEKLTLFRSKSRHNITPEILDEAEQDNVKDLAWSVLIWI
jgi:hypothetical protein